MVFDQIRLSQICSKEFQRHARERNVEFPRFNWETDIFTRITQAPQIFSFAELFDYLSEDENLYDLACAHAMDGEYPSAALRRLLDYGRNSFTETARRAEITGRVGLRFQRKYDKTSSKLQGSNILFKRSHHKEIVPVYICEQIGQKSIAGLVYPVERRVLLTKNRILAITTDKTEYVNLS
jgi:hypothetical protein